MSTPERITVDRHDEYLSEAATVALVGVSRRTIWRWMAAGTFPQRVRPLSWARFVAWRRSDVMAWLAKQGRA